MKILLILLTSISAFAAPFTLVWDGNPPSDNVVLYNIYTTPITTNDWRLVATVSTNTFTTNTLSAAKWSIRAVSADGSESKLTYVTIIGFTNAVLMIYNK